MNIICNNCIGARIYEVTQKRFPNPFMWSLMSCSDFIALANEYDDLNLSNVSFELEYYLKNTYKSVLAVLENDVKVHFIHYIQDDEITEPIRKNGTDMYCKDILSYAKEKWFGRLERTDEPPTFLFSFNYMKKDNPKYYDMLNQLFACVRKKMIVLIHDSVEADFVIPDDISIVKCGDDVMELNGSALAKAIKQTVFKNEL